VWHHEERYETVNIITLFNTVIFKFYFKFHLLRNVTALVTDDGS
jgi:hypothetical protein